MSMRAMTALISPLLSRSGKIYPPPPLYFLVIQRLITVGFVSSREKTS
jgi:hypothetical protein